VKKKKKKEKKENENSDEYCDTYDTSEKSVVEFN
jgi:hypothetical protein